MDTDRKQRESANAPGWKWIAKQGVWLWWDGKQYTNRAVWDGDEWRRGPIEQPKPKPHLSPIMSAMTGLAIALFIDFCVVMAAGNSPADDPTWNNEAAWLVFLAVAPIVGFVVGAVLGWARRRTPGE